MDWRYWYSRADVNGVYGLPDLPLHPASPLLFRPTCYRSVINVHSALLEAYSKKRSIIRIWGCFWIWKSFIILARTTTTLHNRSSQSGKLANTWRQNEIVPIPYYDNTDAFILFPIVCELLTLNWILNYVRLQSNQFVGVPFTIRITSFLLFQRIRNHSTQRMVYKWIITIQNVGDFNCVFMCCVSRSAHQLGTLPHYEVLC